MRQLGKYRLLEPVASGGMADVFRAEVPGAAGFVKQVALKLIRGDHDESSEFVRMFIEEARLASRLTHANIVHVFEFDRIEGSYCIAMELVHGRTLRQLVDRCRETGAKLGLARAVHICAEVAKALAYAHRLVDERGTAGIVHRDVSPQNILVSFEGEVKLTDFGIARAMGRAGLTEPGTIKGKAAYMAPEQARGGPVDVRADVFSLAVVLWELCAGRRLFARDSDAATLTALLGEHPVSAPSHWNEAVPEALDAAIMAALERDPEKRTPGAQELVTALSAVLLRLAKSPEETDLRALMHRLWPEGATPPSTHRAEPTVRRVAAEPEAGSEGDEETTRTASAGAIPRALRRRLGLALAGLGVVALAGGLAVTVRQTRPVAKPSPGPAAAESPVAGPPRTEPPVALPATSPPVKAADMPPSAADPSPEPAPATPPARPARRTGAIVATHDGLNTIALPAPQSGDGVLSVNASPWGAVTIDGKEVGYTPRDVRLQAGRHRVRITHPTLGRWVRTVVVAAGRRSHLHARFEPPRSGVKSP